MVEQVKLSDSDAEYTTRDLSVEMINTTNPRGGVHDVGIIDAQMTMTDGNYPRILAHAHTDAGVVGTGETYWNSGDTIIIERMKPFLVGENPPGIDRLYEHPIQKMFGEGFASGKVISTISNIEVALRDVAEKLLDVPACQLVSGKYRGEVRVCCDLHTENKANPQAYAGEGVRVVKELGYGAIKLSLDVPSGHEKDRANRYLRDLEIDHKTEIVEAVTEAVGDRVDVALDCHWSFTGGSTKHLAPELEDYDVWWPEDLMLPENYDVQKPMMQSTMIPIVVDENVYRKFGQRTPLESQAVDIIASDLSRAGDIRETRKTADLANMYYAPVAMCNVSSPIGTMASTQVVATIPNLLVPEHRSHQLSWWEDLVEEDGLIQNSHTEVLEKSGPGLTSSLDAVEAHIVEREMLFDEEQPDAKGETVP